MKKQIKTIILFTMVLIWVAAVAVGPAQAQNVKERMRERLPKIVELKANGIVGENNQGYLEVLKGKQAPGDVVAEENKDRREAYQAIAEQTKTQIDIVGQRRAIQIAEKAGSGEWLQNGNGQWYQKP